MALPGPGFGVGTVWWGSGEEVAVRMRARWVSGRASWAIVLLGLVFEEGFEGWVMLGVCGGRGFQLGMGETEGARLYVNSRNDSGHSSKRFLDYLRLDSWAVVAVRTKVLTPTFISGAFSNTLDVQRMLL